MTLSDWCDYDNYDCLVGGCENCKLNEACNCILHCNYQVFSDLTKLETKDQVKAEMNRMLGYRKHPTLKGKYFWDLACDGRGTWSRPRTHYKVTNLAQEDEEVEIITSP